MNTGSKPRKELWALSAAQEKGEAMEIVDGEGRHVSISLE